ncbi:unnamed protein product [Larinioides sclopetarius]
MPGVREGLHFCI